MGLATKVSPGRDPAPVIGPRVDDLIGEELTVDGNLVRLLNGAGEGVAVFEEMRCLEKGIGMKDELLTRQKDTHLYRAREDKPRGFASNWRLCAFQPGPRRWFGERTSAGEPVPLAREIGDLDYTVSVGSNTVALSLTQGPHGHGRPLKSLEH